MAVTAITTALFDRERTGGGAHIDISLAESATWMLSGVEGHLSDSGWNIPQSPPRHLYECSDGRWVSIAADEPRTWTALCTALGLADLAAAGRPSPDDADAVQAQLAAAFATRPAAEWVADLGPGGVTISFVHEGSTLVDDPHVRARGAVVEVGGQPVPANPIRIAGAHGPVDDRHHAAAGDRRRHRRRPRRRGVFARRHRDHAPIRPAGGASMTSRSICAGTARWSPVRDRASAAASRHAFASAGAEILVNDFVAERAAAVVDELTALGATAAAVPFDVSDYAAVHDALGDAGADIIVNNAGNAGPEGFTFSPFADSEPGRLGPLLRRQPARRHALHACGAARDDRAGLGPRRDDRVGGGPLRRTWPGRVFGGESRRRGVHPLDRPRGRAARDQREQRGLGVDRLERDDARADLPPERSSARRSSSARTSSAATAGPTTSLRCACSW